MQRARTIHNNKTIVKFVSLGIAQPKLGAVIELLVKKSVCQLCWFVRAVADQSNLN